MICVGIDPGLAALGASALRREPRRWTLLEAHTVRTRPTDADRLRTIVLELQALCHRTEPSVLVVEDTAGVWHGHQRETGRVSAEAISGLLRVQGAVEALAVVLRIPCVTIAPRVWRAHYGLTKARDARIKELAARLFGEGLRKASIHCSEAALLGACGAGRVKVAA